MDVTQVLGVSREVYDRARAERDEAQEKAEVKSFQLDEAIKEFREMREALDLALAECTRLAEMAEVRANVIVNVSKDLEGAQAKTDFWANETQGWYIIWCEMKTERDEARAWARYYRRRCERVEVDLDRSISDECFYARRFARAWKRAAKKYRYYDQWDVFVYVARCPQGCCVGLRIDKADKDTARDVASWITDGCYIDRLPWSTYYDEIRKEKTFLRCNHPGPNEQLVLEL